MIFFANLTEHKIREWQLAILGLHSTKILLAICTLAWMLSWPWYVQLGCMLRIYVSRQHYMCTCLTDIKLPPLLHMPVRLCIRINPANHDSLRCVQEYSRFEPCINLYQLPFTQLGAALHLRRCMHERLIPLDDPNTAYQLALSG